MQYLKEEIRNTILQGALQEFADKGFMEASMRNIARNAGVSLGNVYRYFKSKDELFNELMAPAYNSLMLDPELLHGSNDAILNLESIVSSIMMILKKYRTELLILMDKSNGTIYENSKEQVIQFAKQKLQAALLPALRKKGVQVGDDYIFYVMAATFTEGFFIILRKYEDEDKIKYLIRQLMFVYFYDLDSRFK